MHIERAWVQVGLHVGAALLHLVVIWSLKVRSTWVYMLVLFFMWLRGKEREGWKKISSSSVYIGF